MAAPQDTLVDLNSQESQLSDMEGLEEVDIPDSDVEAAEATVTTSGARGGSRTRLILPPVDIPVPTEKLMKGLKVDFRYFFPHIPFHGIWERSCSGSVNGMFVSHREFVTTSCRLLEPFELRMLQLSQPIMFDVGASKVVKSRLEELHPPFARSNLSSADQLATALVVTKPKTRKRRLRSVPRPKRLRLHLSPEENPTPPPAVATSVMTTGLTPSQVPTLQ